MTAQRRSENLQKVPIAISVVSGNTLKNAGTTDLSAIRDYAPSVSFANTPANPTYAVRGIGTSAFDASVETAVGVAVDDVDITLPRATVLDQLIDVDRVEILRGPQGTLFGRNTTAGLISITTHKPDLGVYSDTAHLQDGSRNQIEAYDIVNIPVGDTFAMRLHAGYQILDTIPKVVGPGSIASTRDYDFNGKFLWQPTERLSLYAIGRYQSVRDGSGEWTVRSIGTPALAASLLPLGIVPGPDNNTAAVSADSYRQIRTKGGQLSINYDLDFATLTSVTAYYRNSYHGSLEADESPRPILDYNVGAGHAHQVSQELRLANKLGGKFDYVAGLYYNDVSGQTEQDTSGTFGILPDNSPVRLSAQGGLAHYITSTQSYAVFGQGTYHLTDRLRAIVGARYTHDKVVSSTFVTPIVGVIPLKPVQSTPIGGTRKHGDWSGRFGAEYDLAAKTLLYATASRGYKGAAVSTVSGYVFNVNPETVWSYEAGLKTTLLDNRLTANIAAFYSNFDQFQTEVFDPSLGPSGAFRTGNAGGLKSRGAELEFTARPVEHLNLSGGVTYANATFTNYNPPCYAIQTAAQGCTLPGPTFDASGDKLPNAPLWSWSVSGTYDHPIGDKLKGYVSANYSYRSAVVWGVGDPNIRQPGYGLTNFTIGIGDNDDRVRATLFVRNAFNKHFASPIFASYFDKGGYSQVLSDEAFRRIGGSLDFRF